MLSSSGSITVTMLHIVAPLLQWYKFWYHNGALASGSVTVRVDCSTMVQVVVPKWYLGWWHHYIGSDCGITLGIKQSIWYKLHTNGNNGTLAGASVTMVQIVVPLLQRCFGWCYSNSVQIVAPLFTMVQSTAPLLQ